MEGTGGAGWKPPCGTGGGGGDDPPGGGGGGAAGRSAPRPSGDDDDGGSAGGMWASLPTFDTGTTLRAAQPVRPPSLPFPGTATIPTVGWWMRGPAVDRCDERQWRVASPGSGLDHAARGLDRRERGVRPHAPAASARAGRGHPRPLRAGHRSGTLRPVRRRCLGTTAAPRRCAAERRTAAGRPVRLRPAHRRTCSCRSRPSRTISPASIRSSAWRPERRRSPRPTSGAWSSEPDPRQEVES
jgi:hypothetical protein